MIYSGNDDIELDKIIDDILQQRNKVFDKAKKIKFSLLVLCIIGYIKELIDAFYYSLNDRQVSFGIVAFFLALFIVFSFGFIKKTAFISTKSKRELNSKIKNLLYKYIIRKFNDSAEFEPVYNRTISSYNIGKIIGIKVTEVKEEDFISYTHNDIEYSISEMLILNGIKKVFDGLFIIVDIKHKVGNVLEFQNDMFSKIQQIIQIQNGSVYRVHNCFFILIPNKKNLFDVDLNKKKEKIIEKIFDDIGYLNYVFDLLQQIESILEDSIASKKYDNLPVNEYHKPLGEYSILNSKNIILKFIALVCLWFGISIAVELNYFIGGAIALFSLYMFFKTERKVFLFETNKCIHIKQVLWFKQRKEENMPVLNKIVVKYNYGKRRHDVFFDYSSKLVLINSYCCKMDAVKNVKIICSKSGVLSEWE